jgi:hypothetical protein
MQSPQSHAVLRAAVPDARGGGRPASPPERPPREARRRLPLPHRAPAEGRYVRYEYNLLCTAMRVDLRKIATRHMPDLPKDMPLYMPLGRRRRPPRRISFALKGM